MSDDWDEWKNKILSDIARLNETTKSIDSTVDKINMKIVLLEYKSTLWGIVGAGIVTVAYHFFNGKVT